MYLGYIYSSSYKVISQNIHKIFYHFFYVQKALPEYGRAFRCVGLLLILFLVHP